MIRRAAEPAMMRLRYAVSHVPDYWRGAAEIPRERASVARKAADVLRGYDPREADWYRQIHGHADGFVTNFDRVARMRAVNGPDGYVVDNKLVLAQILSGEGIPTPRLYGVGTHGEWRFAEGGEASIAEAFATGGRVAVKPVRGRKGQGFRIATRREELALEPGEVVIATAFAENAPYAKAVFGEALNTIRVLMIRTDDGQPVPVAAVHRFGSAASAPVDNFSAGGVVAPVDLDTGVLGAGLVIGAGNAVRFVGEHPETGGAIDGVAVAHWTEVLSLVARLGQALPFLRYVGWDIAVTPGGPVVIEGNSHPSLRFFQFFGPLGQAGPDRAFLAKYLPRLRTA